MHGKNLKVEVLDSARRVHSNAIIPDASGALFQEVFVAEGPPSLPLVALSAALPPGLTSGSRASGWENSTDLDLDENGLVGKASSGTSERRFFQRDRT
jgi:hypothetical protein